VELCFTSFPAVPLSAPPKSVAPIRGSTSAMLRVGISEETRRQIESIMNTCAFFIRVSLKLFFQNFTDNIVESHFIVNIKTAMKTKDFTPL
jgi:hypothetical protein